MRMARAAAIFASGSANRAVRTNSAAGPLGAALPKADAVATKRYGTKRAAQLLFSAQRWEMAPEMKERIRSGETLVVDR